MRPPQDDLYEVMRDSVDSLGERSVVVVTSKVVAIDQGRCVKQEEGVDREEWAKKEADLYADRDVVPGEHLLFTIKDDIIIASAGIDKSNSAGYLILWPDKPMEAAREIQVFLKKEFGVKELGVIVTDSHVTPMRRGVVGISLGHWGFNPVRDERGSKDIFGEKLRVTVVNVVDALAVAAVVEMGEGDEQTPIAVITEAAFVEFSEDENINKGKPALRIPKEEDLFKAMLDGVEWKKGKSGK